MAAPETELINEMNNVTLEETSNTNTTKKKATTFTSDKQIMIKSFQDCDTASEEGLFCISWSPDNKLVAASIGDNRIILVKGNGEIDKVLSNPNLPSYPITAVQWRPISKLLKTEQVLVSGGTSGDIDYWHVPSGKKICTIHEENNEIYSLDYRLDGQKLATGGKDLCIRIYDEATKKEEIKFERGVLHNRGHSNRIFALKFHPEDPNLIFSASWDKCLMCWDRRTNKCVRSIFGPYVCGEALCVQNDTIVTGSWRVDDVIETWDIGTGLRMKSIKWPTTPMVYSMKPHPKIPGIFACGGTGNNVIRVFDINSDFKTEIAHLPDQQGIYSLDFDTTGEFIVYGGNSPHLSFKRLDLPVEQFVQDEQKKFDLYA